MYPDGTSKNLIYRQGTTPVPGFDELAYCAPKRYVPPEPTTEPTTTEPTTTETTTAPSDTTVAPTTQPTTTKPAENNEFLEGISKLFEKISSAFGKFFDGLGTSLENLFLKGYEDTQSYIEENGLKAEQPEPDAEWDNTDSVSPQVFILDYDWRLSPIDLADQLNDYIKAVKAYTHSDKVYLQSLSASASVALAYLDKYVVNSETVDIAGIIMSCPVGNGMGAYGTLMQKKLLLDASALGNATVIKPIMTNVDPKVHALLQTLYLTGLLDLAFSALELAPDEFFDAMFDEGLIPCYGTFPGMWSLVPPDMYTAAKKACFSNKTLYPDEVWGDFIAKIDEYYELELRQDELLQATAAKIKTAIVVGYGETPWAIAQTQGQQGDTAVETKYSSFGATLCKLGDTLGESYKQKNACGGHNHVSPDLQVDASTCALPENTWFIKGFIHGSEYDYNGFFAWWYSTENPTVFSSERWPQYLYAYGNITEGECDAIYPLQTPVYSGSDSIDRLSSLWVNVLSIWRSLLYFITGLGGLL